MEKNKLFCIPYAGGSSIVYNSWQKFFDINFDLSLIELSGRGERHKSAFYQTFDEAVADVFKNIKNGINTTPYALLGHNMGGLIAYELYFKIKEAGLPLPFHIFLSGLRPPHLKSKNISNLPEPEFIKEIIKTGTYLKKILNNNVLADIFLPVLKADYKAFETYTFNNSREKLNCPITVFTGENDCINRDEILQLADYTNSDFNVHTFSEENFFINREQSCQKIIALINSYFKKNELKLFSAN